MEGMGVESSCSSYRATVHVDMGLVHPLLPDLLDDSFFVTDTNKTKTRFHGIKTEVCAITNIAQS